MEEPENNIPDPVLNVVTPLIWTRESKKVNPVKTELKLGAKNGKGRSIALRLFWGHGKDWSL